MPLPAPPAHGPCLQTRGSRSPVRRRPAAQTACGVHTENRTCTLSQRCSEDTASCGPHPEVRLQARRALAQDAQRDLQRLPVARGRRRGVRGGRAREPPGERPALGPRQLCSASAERRGRRRRRCGPQPWRRRWVRTGGLRGEQPRIERVQAQDFLSRGRHQRRRRARQARRGAVNAGRRRVRLHGHVSLRRRLRAEARAL